MTDLCNWRDLDQRRATLHRAAEALAAGQLVVFPLETGYAVTACTVLPTAVGRLAEWCHGASCSSGVDSATNACQSSGMSLVLAGPGSLADWTPAISCVGKRLSRRCWPGPVQLIVDECRQSGLVSRLDPRVRRLLMPDDRLSVRVPAHEAIRQTSLLLPGFLAAVAVEAGDGSPQFGSAQFHQGDGRQVALIVDDGPPPRDQPASIVRLEGGGWQLLREGAVSAAALAELTACLIVFVCTGNTCRSPLAEALCKKRLADCLGCAIEELPQRGFISLSAGLSATSGCPAAEGAVAAARAYGANLEGHVSQPVTATLLRQADYVFAMTQGHLRAITAHLPSAAAWVRLLSPQAEDIPDPIGGNESVYQQCAAAIWHCLATRLVEICQE